MTPPCGVSPGRHRTGRGMSQGAGNGGSCLGYLGPRCQPCTSTLAGVPTIQLGKHPSDIRSFPSLNGSSGAPLLWGLSVQSHQGHHVEGSSPIRWSLSGLTRTMPCSETSFVTCGNRCNRPSHRVSEGLAGVGKDKSGWIQRN